MALKVVSILITSSFLVASCDPRPPTTIHTPRCFSALEGRKDDKIEGRAALIMTIDAGGGIVSLQCNSKMIRVLNYPDARAMAGLPKHGLLDNLFIGDITFTGRVSYVYKNRVSEIIIDRLVLNGRLEFDSSKMRYVKI